MAWVLPHQTSFVSLFVRLACPPACMFVWLARPSGRLAVCCDGRSALPIRAPCRAGSGRVLRRRGVGILAGCMSHFRRRPVSESGRLAALSGKVGLSLVSPCHSRPARPPGRGRVDWCCHVR